MKKTVLVLSLIASLALLNWKWLGAGREDTSLQPPPAQHSSVREASAHVFERIPESVRSHLVDDIPTSADSPREWGGLIGQVRGWKDSGPIPGATVVVYSSDSHLAETNSQGLFAYDNLEEGTYDMVVRAPHWEPVHVEDLFVRAGVRRQLEVVLEAGARFSVDVGSIGDEGLREPVAGASVSLYPGPPSSAALLTPRSLVHTGVHGVTDADGHVLFHEGSPGAYFCVAEAEGYSPWTSEVTVEEGDVLKVDLQRGFLLEGVVTDSAGQTPERGAVYLSPYFETRAEKGKTPRHFLYTSDAVELDAQGRFQFPGMPAGQHHLAALLGNGETAITHVPVTTGESARSFVSLKATGLARIHGQVVDTSGEPIEGVEI